MDELVEVTDIFKYIISFNNHVDCANLMLVNKDVCSMVRENVWYLKHFEYLKNQYSFVKMCNTGNLKQAKLLYAYSLEHVRYPYLIFYLALTECVQFNHINVFDWFYSYQSLRESIAGHAECQAFQLLCTNGYLDKAKEIYSETNIDTLVLESAWTELDHEKYPNIADWLNKTYGKRTNQI